MGYKKLPGKAIRKEIKHQASPKLSSTMATVVYYLYYTLRQWWFKACGSNQPLPDLTESPLYKMKSRVDIITLFNIFLGNSALRHQVVLSLLCSAVLFNRSPSY